MALHGEIDGEATRTWLTFLPSYRAGFPNNLHVRVEWYDNGCDMLDTL